MDGWTVQPGPEPYLGTLVQGEQTIHSNVWGSAGTCLSRPTVIPRLHLPAVFSQMDGNDE
jgi:hypothetical protein